MASYESCIKFVNHNIPHIQQRFNWDCGITCILMILSKAQRKEFYEHFTKVCLEEGFGQSTWTIDLCYLLNRFDVKHRLYTASQAANNRCYSQEIVDRVQNRFKNAPYNGIKVVDGILSTKQLFMHVVKSGPAITLVDAALLSCDWCKHNKLRSEFRRILGGNYQGHYIVVVGWSAGKLLYHNPARQHRLCATTLKRLQAARSAPGTDYDVVLIY